MTIPDSIEAATAVEPRPHSAWRDAAVVFLIALACYFPFPLNTPLAATEGHRAMTAHQMVESGQWLIPKLYGRVYLAKPPLHYWILATSETLFGTTQPWVWRLPGAIEGALLAAILCLFANRWFGRIGGLVGGLSYVAMFTLWGENRGADIDVTNTLTATFACLCLIELHLGRRGGLSAVTELNSGGIPEVAGDQPRPLQSSGTGLGIDYVSAPIADTSPGERALIEGRQGGARWAVAAGVAIGASLMVKGPASLTIILGALIWIGIASIRSHGWSWLAKPVTWLPLMIGIAIFAIYALAAWYYITTRHLVPDLSGVQEGAQDLHRHNINAKQVVEWLTLPLMMFLFTLPVSLSLIFALNPEVRGSEPVRARIMLALAWSVLLAWGICFLSGMHLPRYAFVTLPLLCPLAGAVASRVPVSRPQLGYWLRVIVGCTAVGFFAAAVFLTVKAWKPSAHNVRAIMVVLAVTVLILAAITLHGLRRDAGWRAAWGVPAMLVLVSLLFGTMQHYDRVARTSIPQAQLIRSITGPDAHLVTCQMVLDQPDLFYYSGLPTRATDDDLLNWREVPLGTWVVLEPPELEKWKAEIPGRLWKETKFVANRNPGILLWYGDAPPVDRK